MQPILKVRDLITRFYTVDGVIYALNGVGFDLKEGETLGVVGESGSGKSVTMMSLVGLIPQPPGKIEAGTAELYDAEQTVELLHLPEKEMEKVRGRQIGFIFQDPISSLNPLMAIGDQIAEAMITHFNVSREQARQRTVDLLRLVGIADADARYDSYPHEFSGGMRQRVVIAIAVAYQPRIVIADEPTTALDVTVQAQIVELIKRLQAEFGMAVVWISHDLGVVAGLADRVMVMYGGIAVEVGPVDELYENPHHPYTIGLLGAIPTLDEDGRKELASIEGSPPDLLRPLDQCPFASRCPYVFDRCLEMIPPLLEVGPDHFAACFYDVKNKKQRS